MLPLAVITLMGAQALPAGPSPEPVSFPHFPDRLHAFIWRNWQLAPTDRLAHVIDAQPADVLRIGKAMGLSDPPPITQEQRRRSYITVIRRNWHLMPYEQVLELLGWTEEQLAYTLREDDFLFIKLGRLKPRCEALRYTPPDDQTLAREREMARIVHEAFPEGVGPLHDPLFSFVDRLCEPRAEEASPAQASGFHPRFCYSYFALYGDPLLEREADPYPDGYLARLAAAGVNGVWLQAVLYKLAPFPWDETLSERWEARLQNVRGLVARARGHGIGVYLYLTEPRAMPLAFFDRHPGLRGVVEGDYAVLCTSEPAVQEYLSGAVASVCRAVPDLAGFFTITASENLTNCWSHHNGADCPRCGKRSPAEVIAEVNALVRSGIREAGSKARLIAWDWGWSDDWAEAAINALPTEATLMSVSEWSIPIQRGGVDTIIGEYSISAIGPGPRAQRHWSAARKRGLKTIAKIQAGNTWELAAVPYIPAVENVARHAANLRDANVDGLMLGWTLGGYPSPNLEVVAEIGKTEPVPNERAQEAPSETGLSPFPATSPEQAMETVARRRFGADAAPAVVQAWRRFSEAFSEFPFHTGTVYTAPLQVGPANLLWGEPTGYHATMVGIPYDDLDAWRAVYPPEVFIAQFTKIADGFDSAITDLKASLPAGKMGTVPSERGQGPPTATGLPPVSAALQDELNVAEAAAIHFRSVANQARFVVARRALADAATAEAARPALDALETTLQEEITLARRLYAIQTRDSRIGFEASNQYFCVPVDLAEKVLNCRDLLTRWLPAQRARFGI